MIFFYNYADLIDIFKLMIYSEIKKIVLIIYLFI